MHFELLQRQLAATVAFELSLEESHNNPFCTAVSSPAAAAAVSSQLRPQVAQAGVCVSVGVGVAPEAVRSCCIWA
jgi:hypothetical protein